MEETNYELRHYIEGLNLKKIFYLVETEYIFNDNYLITIEKSGNIFFVKNKVYIYMEKYTHIKTYKQLKALCQMYMNIDIEYLRRKEKLKKIKECYQKREEEK